jgi:hypothetical protein
MQLPLSIQTALQRRRLALRPLGALLLSLGFVIVCVICLNPRYMANDNLAIVDFIAQGSQVQYVGVFFTLLLHGLYAAVPGAPWYPIALYALNVLSLALWLMLLMRVCYRPWLAVLLIVALLTCYLRFLVFLDYTSTAILLCASALAWAGVETLERRPLRWQILAAGCVFMLGLWVRPQVPMGMLAYAFPLGVWVILLSFRGRPFHAESKRLALVALLFLLPTAVNYAADTACRQLMRTPQEAQYDDFNALRGNIHRLSRPRKQALISNRPLLHKIHWKAVDVAYLYNWCFLDERVYTPASLRALLDAAPLPRISLDALRSLAVDRLSSDYAYLLIMAPLLLTAMVVRRGGWRHLAALLAPLWCLGATLTMLTFFGFLFRVELPFEMGFGFGSLVLANRIFAAENPQPDRLRLAGAGLAALLALLAALSSLSDTVHDYRRSQDTAARVTDEIEVLNRDYAGATILLQARGEFVETLDPLHPPVLRFNTIHLGWSTFSPRFYSEIGKLGVEHGYEVVDALIRRPDAYMLGIPGWPSELLYYATDTDRRDIRVLTAREFSTGMILYRFEEKPAAKR